MTMPVVELDSSEGLRRLIYSAHEAEQGKTEGALAGLEDTALRHHPSLYLEL